MSDFHTLVLIGSEPLRGGVKLGEGLLVGLLKTIFSCEDTTSRSTGLMLFSLWAQKNWTSLWGISTSSYNQRSTVGRNATVWGNTHFWSYFTVPLVTKMTLISTQMLSREMAVTNHNWPAVQGELWQPHTHTTSKFQRLFLFARVSIQFTYFTWASACMKMNSHFLAKALCSLAKFS